MPACCATRCVPLSAAAAWGEMLRVGLTGGVASGKSRLAALLADAGAAVRDADQVVAELYRPGGAGTTAVMAEFGSGMLAADGGVDRARLGARVLNDPAARRRLEQLVHPLVQREVEVWLEGLAASPAPPAVAVVEAALLVETGSWRGYHRLVVVEAPLPQRRQRALAAGWRAEVFDAVVAAQATDEARRAVAHYVVVNDGSVNLLRDKANRLWAALGADAERLHTGVGLPAGVTVLA